MKKNEKMSALEIEARKAFFELNINEQGSGKNVETNADIFVKGYLAGHKKGLLEAAQEVDRLIDVEANNIDRLNSIANYTTTILLENDRR